MNKIVIASGNAGKLQEFADLFAPLAIEVVAQSVLGVPEAGEPHATFIENALAKARNASLHTGLAALADDSGLCVNALGGKPGVHSARFAGDPKSDARNNAHLVRSLDGVADRTAYYYCVVVLLRRADDSRPIFGEGIWHGEIVSLPRGDGGFGYDPYFFVPTSGMTAAEMTPAQKNALSHRALALQALLRNLREAPP